MTVPPDERQRRRDRRLMSKALRVARRGRPSPNPHVGAVIADDEGKVLAEGFHAQAGEAHAEVDALREAGDAARGATMFVTFEPCNHFGRTPPCTDAIIAAGLSRVVVGCRDTAPHVPGAIEKLRRAGIEVTVGVRETEALRLVADFTKHIRTGLPFVTLKAAVTLDGRIATRTGESKWLTGEGARARAHRMRDRSDAVLVGIGTVLADDPELTVRHVPGRTPLRVVLDRHLRIPPGGKLVAGANENEPVLVFHGPDAEPARRTALSRPGLTLVQAPVRDEHLDLDAVLRELGQRQVVRLMVEGGGEVHGSFLRLGLADRLAFFVAPVLFGDPEATPAVSAGPLLDVGGASRLVDVRHERLGTDVLVIGELPRR